MKKITAIAIILIVLGLIIYYFIFVFGLQTIYVYDYDTNKPVLNAQVTIDFCCLNGLGGGDITKTYFTNSSGKISFPPTNGTAGLFAQKPLKADIKKEGYYEYYFGEYLAMDPFSQKAVKVKIRKPANPQNLIVVTNIKFQSSDKADILTALAEKDLSKIKNYPSNIQTSNTDFNFPEISYSSEKGKNTSSAKIQFYGEGGIQQIAKDGYYGNLENLFAAPAQGYKQELQLEHAGQYVARLSDGKHYMKMQVFIDSVVGKVGEADYVQINFYIQPEQANKNLEFLPNHQSINL